MATQGLVVGWEVDRWEQVIYAFQAEEERRSGPGRIIPAYFRMFPQFFGSLGKTQSR